ncbi:relaxase/mobilization nuclease domain-containing protein [Flavobacterium oreochromis]|uniref:Relaxase/mobilization nuclease domain-containing protein n=1 Tax=Flavobacterium oreochromis TaxID=2906078 RepID=A0ABW8PEF5_9FLAO|nr:relaxase/mobilization nuclease domain-containing protein [Flavobacterium oreochromis]OWP75192.1 hypothetical protein BWG23_11670 [Flavobacterium oreochromis]
MVGKAKSISHTSNAIDYGKDKMNSQEISRHNVIGNSGYEIEQEFKIYQNLNDNAKLNTISVVISPDANDGRKLTNEDFKEITNSYLEKMNLKENQHIAYVHRDRDHTHIHLYVNRIDAQGKAYNDSYIGKKTHHKVHEIAKERGLISAKEKMIENINNIQQNKGSFKILKNEIFKKHQEILNNKPGTFSKYKEEMLKQGLEINPTINKQGEIQGFRILDLKTKTDFKASEVNRSMSVGNLIKSGLKNDLNNQLNNNLQLQYKKQNNIGIAKELKKSLKPSKTKTLEKKPMFKQKMTLKERIAYSKIEDNMIENINIKNQDYWNELPKQQIEKQNKDNER